MITKFLSTFWETSRGFETSLKGQEELKQTLRWCLEPNQHDQEFAACDYFDIHIRYYISSPRSSSLPNRIFCISDGDDYPLTSSFSFNLHRGIGSLQFQRSWVCSLTQFICRIHRSNEARWAKKILSLISHPRHDTIIHHSGTKLRYSRAVRIWEKSYTFFLPIYFAPSTRLVTAPTTNR